MATVIDRVDRLEEALEHFITSSVLNYVEKLGFLVLAVGDEIMEVKNRPGFEPKRW